MPSDLLKKNYYAIYRCLFKTADENRHIPPFLYVAKPSCMVAFDWPVTKVLDIYPRRRLGESFYVLLPQDFDYTSREECDWTPLETIDGFPISSFQSGFMFSYVPSYLSKKALCFVSSLYPKKVRLKDLSYCMKTLQVFVFTVESFEMIGSPRFLPETHRPFSMIACLKIFLIWWRKWAKEKGKHRRTFEELKALPPFGKFPGGSLFLASMVDFDSHVK